jgi:RNA polymerase I-specific transcription initiation factor RRN3
LRGRRTRLRPCQVEIQVDIEDLEEYEGALDDAVFGYTLEDPFNKPIGQDDSDESDAEADATLPFDFDDLSSEGSAGEDDDNTLDGHEPRVNVLDKPEAVAQLKEMAGKLDSILRVIFSEFEAINRALSPPRFTHGAAPHASSSPNKLTPVGTPIDGEIQRRTIFDALLTVFDHVVLRTFKTRHTQFLLFWYSSLHPDFNDRFTATLIHTALYDAARPAVARISASSYLASYISRAKFVSPENTRIAVRLLCDWLETEFHEHAPSPVSSVASFFDPPAKAMKAQQLAVFYAVFQAAIYMFCYRWKDLCFSEMEDEEDEMAPAGTRRWLPQLTVVKDIIFSHLDPLKVCLYRFGRNIGHNDFSQFCSANVVRQFVRIAHHVHFSYCYTVLERNNRARRSSPATPTTPRPFSLPLTDELKAERTEQAIAGMLEEAKIETHFPFDPYKLPLTSRYIDGIFKEFEAPEGMVDEEEDSSDEEAAVVAVLDGTQPLSVSSGSTSEDAAFSTSFDSQMSLG